MAITLVVAATVPMFAPKLLPVTGWVAFAAASFALLGFLTREFFALRASRKQHTVTVLLQSRMSTAFNDRYKAMRKSYPVTPTLTLVQNGDWNDPDKVEAIEALKYFLNYYEFIAIGVHTGDLDEEYLYKSLCGIVHNLCHVSSAYIEFCRSQDDKLFENLLWLRDRWASYIAIERGA